MAEAIHCPSCSTRYRLRPERLSASHRRAQCFTCQGVFPIGDVVQRLLGAAPAEARAGEFEPREAADAPSLTLGDLEGAEEEILDKTLAELPGDLPEAKAEPVPLPSLPPEITESTLSGYTSARDAIEKLFGAVPAPPSEPKAPSPMDLEATLSALEETLGGTTPAPAPPGAPRSEESTAAGTTATPANLALPPSPSTVRFTRDEVMAAMTEAGMVRGAAEPTVSLRASDLAEPLDATQAAAKTLFTGPLPIPTPPAPGTPEAELLRLRIGEEIYAGLTMPQLIQWVEEGRILEGHLVARQFSENWIEAYKVPGLRPAFDRLRRERAMAQGASLGETPAPEGAPMKKSLFGGLFGGKN